jgi:hypothetical protein
LTSRSATAWRFRRRDEHRDFHRRPRERGFQVGHVLDHEAVEPATNLIRIPVEKCHDVESPLAESAILHQGAADLSGDQRHPVVPCEAENLP